YGQAKKKLSEEASIDEMKDSQTNVSGALFVTFNDDPNVTYLAFPGVRGISAEQGCGLSHDIKDVLSLSSASLEDDQEFQTFHNDLQKQISEKREQGKHIVFSGHCLGAARAEKALKAFVQEGDALFTFAPVIKSFNEKACEDFAKENPGIAMYNFTLEDDFWFCSFFKALMKPFSHSTALGTSMQLTAPSNDWRWNAHRAKRHISAVRQWLKTLEGQQFSQKLKQRLTASR
ncbi:MAG: hypothetical protein ACPG7U_04645, partial [Holosporaceae bacterium]